MIYLRRARVYYGVFPGLAKAFPPRGGPFARFGSDGYEREYRGYSSMETAVRTTPE